MFEKKFDTRVLAVESRVIRDISGDKGVVVQTVRDAATKVLVSTENFDLKEVEFRGLPLPNVLK